MPTTQKTSQQFDPSAMGTYQGIQGPLSQMLQSYMQNPFGNPFFQTQQQMGTKQAENLGQTGMSNISRNMTASGMGGGGSMSPFALEMMQNQGRANTGLQAQLGFQNPVQNALGMQQFAGGLASQFRPLQTGQTQSTSGLGTWLPQIAGLGMGLATGGLGGGLGSLFGRGGGGGGPMSYFPGNQSSPSDYSGQGNAASPWAGSSSGYNPFMGGGAPPPAPTPGGGMGGIPPWMTGL